MSAPHLDMERTAPDLCRPGPEGPKISKVRSALSLWLLGAVLAALAAMLLLNKREVAAPVPVARLEAPVLPPVVAASGQMQPLHDVKISPEVSGEIVELPVKEGQRVHKGQLLLRIKPDFYLADRDQAEGNYKSALANLEVAKAHLQTAQAELTRNQALHRAKMVSDSAFEDVQAVCTIARAQLSSAEGQVETARACLARAQYDVDRTSILSPIDGTVARLNSQLGERVVGTATMAGTEVMSIADLQQMEAWVRVPERDIGRVVCGQKARLELNALPGQTLEGQVVEIASCSEPGASAGQGDIGPAPAFEVRIRLAGKGAFRPGMSVTAKIQTAPPAAPPPTASVKPSGHRWTS